MKACDRFQTELLEHLYGVLEPDESQALADHLGGCSACQTELARAEEQMALIAAAAKAEFPWVRFNVPMETLPSTGAREETGRPWLRWGVAAAILLTLAGIGTPGVWIWRQQQRVTQAEVKYKEAEKELAGLDARQQEILQAAQSIKKDFREKTDAIDRTLADIPEETGKLAKEFRERTAKTFADLNAKQMNLIVVGPKTAEAGALNPFQIQTKDLRQRAVPARISVSITDQNDRVVYKKEDVASQGIVDVSLPRDLPLKPSTRLNLLVSAKGEQGQQALLKEPISLTGPVYLTHLATDKPMYRPGETVRFRSLTLERFSLKPAAEDLHLVYSLSKPSGEKREILRGSSPLVKGQDKAPILGPDHEPVRGIGAGEHRIDPDALEGEYTLTVSELNGRFAPQDRKFAVYRSQKAQHNKEASAKVDVPPGKNLIVEFFPEGGDLVAGLSNRVYFQVLTAAGKPAELTGRIVDEANQAVAEIATWNSRDHAETSKGTGVFTFTPQAGKTYQLKIDRPGGIAGNHLLPAAKTDGILLSIPKGVIGEKEPIEVRIQSGGKDRSLLIGAYCRGRLMAQQAVDVKKGEAKEIKLGPESGVGGVYRVTVFEREAGQGSSDHLVPRAERLIYRLPAERLNVAVKPEKGSYVPGEKVSLGVEARNEKNEPVGAIVMVAVVDQSVLKRAGERTYRSMPAHFFLTTEVRRPEDLENADFLLSEQPGAAMALDLLLGTQGWRRFAEQDQEKFRKKQKEEAQRWLALNGQLPTRTVDYSQEEVKRVVKEFQIKASQLEGRLAKTEQIRTVIQKGEPQKKELARLQKDAEVAGEERRAAILRMDDAKTIFAAAANKLSDSKDPLQHRALPALMVLFLIAGIAGLGIGLVRGRTPQAVPYFATAACSLLVFGVLAMTKLALSNGTILGNESGFALDNTGSGAPGGLSEKDRLALFSLEYEPLKKDRSDGRMPAPRIMPITPIGPKKALPTRPPQDVTTQNRNVQLEKQEAAPDNDRLPDEAPDQKKPTPPRGRTFAGIPLPPPAPPPLVVREYAHLRAHGENQGRGDFAETLFWQPVLVLPDGKGEISFELCDAVTAFQVRVMGHTLDGRLAEVTSQVISRKP
jgi:hypothetical protein